MRVLEVCSLGYGGIQNVVYSICNGSNNEFEYYILGVDTDENNIERFEQIGVKTIILPKGISKVDYLKEFGNTIRRIRPDCVHLHQLYFSGYLAAIARKNGVSKVVIQSHNTRGREEGGLTRGAYKWLSKKLIELYGTDYVAVSEDAALELFSERIIKSDNYNLIYNGIDTKRFTNIENEKSYNHSFFSPDNVVVLSVGRLTKQKNYNFLLEIVRHLNRLNNDVKLIIVGEGEDREELESSIAKYKMDQYVDLLGSSDEIASIMKQSQLFVFPSLWEGFGIVLLEAQISGLMCVASSNLPHEVDIGMIKWLDLSAGAEEWANVCQRLIKNHSHYVLKTEAIDSFDEHFIRQQYENIYLRNV